MWNRPDSVTDYYSGDTMSISIALDKHQIRQLIKSLYIAEHVYNSARPEDELVDGNFKLQQFIYQQLRQKGNQDLVAVREMPGVLQPGGKLLEEADALIDEFEEIKFLLDLSTKLALRDLEEKYPDLDFDDAGSYPEIEEELMTLNQTYLPEFMENGVKNLKLETGK